MTLRARGVAETVDPPHGMNLPESHAPAEGVGGRLRGIARSRTHAVDVWVLGPVALVAYVVHSIAWPLSPGRDAGTYLIYYLDMWSSDPIYPTLMLFRTPVAPLFFGSLLELGGSELVEIALGACYVVAILAAYVIGCHWGRRIGIALAVALLLYPPYAALFHTVSSDGLFAFGFIVWLLFVCRTVTRPTVLEFAAHGVALFALVLIRPSALFFVLPMALVPFLVSDLARNSRIASAVAMLGTLAVLLVCWSGYNALRYGDFTVSRTTWAHMPLYRLYVFDHLVEPDNDPRLASWPMRSRQTC